MGKVLVTRVMDSFDDDYIVEVSKNARRQIRAAREHAAGGESVEVGISARLLRVYDIGRYTDEASRIPVGWLAKKPGKWFSPAAEAQLLVIEVSEDGGTTITGTGNTPNGALWGFYGEPFVRVGAQRLRVI